MKHRAAWWVIWVVFLGGCTLNESPITERRCSIEVSCAPGFVCVEGYCQAASQIPQEEDFSEDLTMDDLSGDDLSGDDLSDVEREDTGEDGGDLPGKDVSDPPEMDLPEDLQDVPVDQNDPVCVPREEVCDGVDNDCDGDVDEDLEDIACSEGQGACLRQGLLTCVGGALECAFSSPPVQPGLEVCDGADNDCDGAIDEGPDGEPLADPCYDGPGEELGFSPCTAGVRTCAMGRWSECRGAVYPEPEQCDGEDNDCDGEVDEAPCEVAVGCADREREGFQDLGAFPDIAGCSGSWAGSPSLKAAMSVEACGDDLEESCTHPVGLCASGWAICGADNNIEPFKNRVGQGGACRSSEEAGSGRWVAAFSHCESRFWPNCRSASASECRNSGHCAEPVCCGSGCSEAGCEDAVFGGNTLIPARSSSGCGRFPDELVDGVICCRVD